MRFIAKRILQALVLIAVAALFASHIADGSFIDSLSSASVHLVPSGISLAEDEVGEGEESEGTAEPATNDPIVANLTAPSSSSGTLSAWHLDRINAFEAWEYAQVNNTVTVAVLDTGCLMTHEDLADNILAEYAYDATTDTMGVEDSHGHGTHVAGTIAATVNNELGTAGVSYNCNIIPVDVFDDDTQSSYEIMERAYRYVLELAVEHPELNIRVINMSLTYEVGDHDEVVAALIDEAYEMGIVTVAAAGNGKYTDYVFPSDYETVVSVTALSADGSTPYSNSNYNSAKDICAPGQYVASTSNTGDDSYRHRSGTSMAAPQVSATFALLFALNPDLTVDEAKELIYSTASNENFEVGTRKAGLYGCGVLDVAAAVKACLGIEDDEDEGDDAGDDEEFLPEDPDEGTDDPEDLADEDPDEEEPQVDDPIEDAQEEIVDPEEAEEEPEDEAVDVDEVTQPDIQTVARATQYITLKRR